MDLSQERAARPSATPLVTMDPVTVNINRVHLSHHWLAALTFGGKVAADS